MIVTLNIDGEVAQIVGHFQLLVQSRSNPDEWHSTGWDDDWLNYVCTCKGWMVRKKCRHVAAVERLARGTAVVKLLDEREVPVARVPLERERSQG